MNSIISTTCVALGGLTLCFSFGLLLIHLLDKIDEKVGELGVLLIALISGTVLIAIGYLL